MVTFEVHLRQDFVLPTGGYLEVNVGRPHPVGSGWIGRRLDCLEVVPAFGGQDGGAVKIRIKRRRIPPVLHNFPH